MLLSPECGLIYCHFKFVKCLGFLPVVHAYDYDLLLRTLCFCFIMKSKAQYWKNPKQRADQLGKHPDVYFSIQAGLCKRV